jgi:hypothetical protein
VAGERRLERLRQVWDPIGAAGSEGAHRRRGSVTTEVGRRCMPAGGWGGGVEAGVGVDVRRGVVLAETAAVPEDDRSSLASEGACGGGK